ncbi:hypothetical protein [Campylobacter sputorum]|uniref:hypothetical protein n=1 Tax=Campylobacter sputorum TaxID=206 RepID=UPI00053BFA6B|nr:hypothetical protein [Campylobacter sputorum]
MNETKYYELKGRISEVYERKSKTLSDISEIKRVIISLLNSEFNLKAWEINEAEFKRLNLELKEILQVETRLKEELKNGISQHKP